MRNVAASGLEPSSGVPLPSGAGSVPASSSSGDLPSSGVGSGPAVEEPLDAVTLRLLFLNAFLLRPVSVGVGPWRWEPGAAPAVADRAGELGATVAGAYDVVALAEAFAAEDRRRVLGGWVGRSPAVAVGPPGGWGGPGGWTATSSGLATIVDGPGLVRTERHRYTVGGHRLADADVWAAKGVLLVEVDVGLPGNVEVFSTHLCAGGGLLPVGGDRVAGTDAVRLAQARELAAFVQATHRPGNLVVVVGDMNVPDRSRAGDPGAPLPAPAEDPVPAEGRSEPVDPARVRPHGAMGDVDGPHLALAEALGRIGLEDLWEQVGTGPGPTSGLDRHGAVLGVLDPDDPRFASDLDAPAAVTGPGGVEPSERIDRVFLSRPRPEDGVAVAAAVLRRRPFPRRADAPDRHRLGYLSDHMGLHVELTLAPSP